MLLQYIFSNMLVSIKHLHEKYSASNFPPIIKVSSRNYVQIALKPITPSSLTFTSPLYREGSHRHFGMTPPSNGGFWYCITPARQNRSRHILHHV